MKKDLFKENFEYYIKVREQVEKYDKLMLETFNERRDDNYTNWYEQAAYDHVKKVFESNYKDNDEWFDYFIFECLYPCVNFGVNIVTCDDKEYALCDVDSFYYFCENELEKIN